MADVADAAPGALGVGWGGVTEPRRLKRETVIPQRGSVCMHAVAGGRGDGLTVGVPCVHRGNGLGVRPGVPTHALHAPVLSQHGAVAPGPDGNQEDQQPNPNVPHSWRWSVHRGQKFRLKPNRQNPVVMVSTTRSSASTTGIHRHRSKVVQGWEMPSTTRSPTVNDEAEVVLFGSHSR